MWQHAKPMPPEIVNLDDAWKRVLAEPLVARHGAPLFDNSAVDGYGVRVSDVANADEHPVVLDCVGTVPAGSDATGLGIASGQTLRIFTGAMIPPTVEAMVMREYAEVRGDRVELSRAAAPGAHIRRAGEDFESGHTLLEPGTRLTPSAVGLIAACGRNRVHVYGCPRVTLVSTGDELVPPDVDPAPGQIHDSNSFALRAALRELGISEPLMASAADDPQQLREVLSASLESSDVVITVGGVSVGDHDHVKSVLAELGVDTVFWRVAMKPGKPNYFGKFTRSDGRGVLVFGLPGNPVSAMVSLHVFAAVGLRRTMGATQTDDARWRAPLAAPLHRRPGREEFLRGVLGRNGDRMEVTVLGGQASHMLGGLARANCLVRVDPEVDKMAAGSMVDVLAW